VFGIFFVLFKREPIGFPKKAITDGPVRFSVNRLRLLMVS